MDKQGILQDLFEALDNPYRTSGRRFEILYFNTLDNQQIELKIKPRADEGVENESNK